MKTVTIPQKEYEQLKKEASRNNLLNQLVEGLEDVKAGRIKSFEKL